MAELSELLFRAVQKGDAAQTEQAVMGWLQADDTTLFDPPGRPSHVYVTLLTATQETTIDIVEFRGGLRIPQYPVRIKTDEFGVRYVSGPNGPDAQQFLGSRSTNAAHVGQHADSHRIGGGDTLMIDGRQILPGFVFALSGTIMRLGTADEPTIYWVDGAPRVLPVVSVDWSANEGAIASGMQAWIGLGIDIATDTPTFVNGTDQSGALPALNKLTIADIDFTGLSPLLAFSVSAGQTRAPREGEIVDLRPFAGAYWGTGDGDFFKDGSVAMTGDLKFSGAQTIYGGTAANDDLEIEGTSHATKTTSYVLIQPNGGNIGLGGITAPTVKVEVANEMQITNTTSADAYKQSVDSSGTFTLQKSGGNPIVTLSTLGGMHIGTYLFIDRTPGSTSNAQFEVAGATSGNEGGEFILRKASGQTLDYHIDISANSFRIFSEGAATDIVHILAATGGQTLGLRVQGAVTFDIGAVINETGADSDTRIEGDSLTHFTFWDASAATENIAFLAAAAPNWQSMDRGFFIGDCSAAPTGNPASGGFLYVESGALKYRGSGGTTTTIANA